MLEATVKRLVPGTIRSQLRPLLKQVMSQKRVPHTTFPLSGELREVISASVASSRAPVDHERWSGDFPEPEELERYWGLFERVIRLLEHSSLLEKDFVWHHYEHKRTRGLLKISKDLFGMWAAMHQQPRTVLEIGCRYGRSLVTHLFAHPHPQQCTALLIDPFTEGGSPRSIRAKLMKLVLPTERVHFLVGYSHEVLPKVTEVFPELRFDYVLVDGSHRMEDALNDLRLVRPIVAPGGYVVVDDIGTYGPGVGYGCQEAWNAWKAECEAQEAGSFQFLEYDAPWGFAVAKRR